MILPSPLLVATGNPGKLREIRAILGERSPGELHYLREFVGYVPPAETEPDYLGNARLKAAHAALELEMPALADDSGLEVDALGGAPGPRSARFAGDFATDALNNAKLLHDLQGESNRSARYRCVMALAFPDGRLCVAEGVCEGSIGTEPRGEGGFGYDPYFVLPDGRTMAEISAEDKNRISHRVLALEALLRDLQL